jgi:hypothetical protein
VAVPQRPFSAGSIDGGAVVKSWLEIRVCPAWSGRAAFVTVMPAADLRDRHDATITGLGDRPRNWRVGFSLMAQRCIVFSEPHDILRRMRE